MRHYRITSKFRFTIFVLVMMMAVLTLFGATTVKRGTAGDAVRTETRTYRTVTVCSRDTLWDIAGKYCPEDQDVRKFICEIREVNDLETSDIAVGEKLLIPVEK